MQEIWKDIKGFEGAYQVSNLGRVKSLCCWRGKARHERIRSLSLTRDGYVKLRLLQGSKDVTARVHRLVAEAFIPNPDGLETINHIDGNKQNNVASNLEWADRSEQMYHAYRLGLKKPMQGTISPISRLSEDDVREIRRTFKKGNWRFGASALGRKFGVDHTAILNVVNGVTYKNVI